MLKSFLFFLHRVYTCSYLSSELPQREREQKREGGGEDEAKRGKKEGRHAVKGQTSYSCFSVPFQRMEVEEELRVESLQKRGRAGFNVLALCKMKPVDSQQLQTWMLEIYSCD